MVGSWVTSWHQQSRIRVKNIELAIETNASRIIEWIHQRRHSAREKDTAFLPGIACTNSSGRRSPFPLLLPVLSSLSAIDFQNRVVRLRVGCGAPENSSLDWPRACKTRSTAPQFLRSCKKGRAGLDRTGKEIIFKRNRAKIDAKRCIGETGTGISLTSSGIRPDVH